MDDNTPATKADLKSLETKLVSTLATKDELKHFATKDDLKRFATKNDLKRFATKEEMHTGFSDVMRHFDLTVETVRHDLLGVNRDEIESLKDRVVRLEEHTGIAV